MLSKIVQNTLSKREPSLLERVVQKSVKPSAAQIAGRRFAIAQLEKKEQEERIIKQLIPSLRDKPTTIISSTDPSIKKPLGGILGSIVERRQEKADLITGRYIKDERGKEVFIPPRSPVELSEKRLPFQTPAGTKDSKWRGSYTAKEPSPLESALSRIPEIPARIILEAVEIGRRNINSWIEEGMDYTEPRETQTKRLESILRIDTRRLGSDPSVWAKDTIETAINEYERAKEKYPNRPEAINALSGTKIVVADTLTVLFAVNLAQGITEGTINSLKAATRRLPDNLLIKIHQQQVNPNAILDALRGTRTTPIGEYNTALDFIKKLSVAERRALFGIARSYQEAGLKVPITDKVTPTALGRFAGVDTPKVSAIPPRIKGLLPGEGVAGQAGFINPEIVGKDLVNLAKKAQSAEIFKNTLTKENLALLAAKGFTSDIFYDSVKATTPTTDPLIQEATKYKSAEEFVRTAETSGIEFPLNKIGGLEPQPEPKPTTFRKITEPVEVVLTDQGDFILEAGNHRYHQAVFNQQETIPAKIRIEAGAKPQLEQIWKDAQATPTDITITPTVPEGTPLSKHFERIKPQLDDLATGIGFERINLEEQAKKAFELVERSPNKALRVAYGIDAPPKGIMVEVIQTSLIESLKSAGRIGEATALARRLSLSFTDTAQKLNVAKLDLGSAGERKIEGIIMNDKLVKIGENIPKGIRELEPRQRAINKIKADAEQAIKDSFETTKVGKAEGLLSDMKLTGELRTALAKGFADDNITIQDLYNMSSAQRRDVLEKYVGKEKGRELSGSFERALLSNQKQALRDWVWRNVYEGKGLYKEIELEQARRMFDSGLRARDLRGLTDEQRISKLSKYVGRRNAELLNERFIKAQKGGTLANWEQRVIGSKDLYAHEKTNRILTRLQSIDEMGVLTPGQAKSFMEDFLYIKLGVDVTEAQAKEISRMVKRITTASNKVGDNWTYTNKENVKEYFRARREMEDFMKKINPDSEIDVFTSVGARGSILASLRIPVNSLIFQIIPGISRTIAKRIVAPFLIPGDYKFIDRMHVMLSGLQHPIVNTEFWREQTKMGIEIYKDTGYDVSRMQTLEDGFRYFGEKYTNPVGPTWGESKGVAEKMGAVVRGHARLVQPALKYGAGGTDAIFANAHRAGTTQLLARQTAQLEEMSGKLPIINERDLVYLPGASVGERMTALQREEMLIKEALSFNPQSIQGQYIREMGILDAHHANFTTNEGYGNLAIKLRNILPKGLGQTIAPFAKIPANALGKGFEATGPGVIMGLKKFVNATKLPPGAERNTEMAEGLNQALIAGGLLGTAIILTSMLDNDDFIGAYDFRARSQNNLTTAKNAGSNYIRIGGKWVNLRWAGPLSLPIAAIMTARKNRAEGKSAVIGYGTGVVAGVLDFPVVKEFVDIVKSMEKAAQSESFSSFLNNAGMDMESLRRWIAIRTIPAIISHDVQGLFDETKYDAFGRPIPEKSFKNFIVGANIKEDMSNVLTDEYDRLNTRGYMPVLTDPSGSHIEFLEFFSEVMDDRYYVELLAEHKRDYSFEVFKLINSDKYKNDMSNEERKTAIDNIRKKEILDPIKKHAEKLQKDLGMEGITSEEIAWEKVAYKYGGTVSDYARAFTVDPYNAFRALLTKEELGRIEGNLVELQRFYGLDFDKEGGSQDYKKALMAQHGIPWDKKEDYKLEHILPVSAGGGNDDANLMLVDTVMWQFFTPIDIAIGNAVKDKRITRKQARDLMIDFKINRKITAEEVLEAIR
jgi:hypothetical protein